MSQYYVYVYMDPQINEVYEYKDIKISNKPFYIGVSKNRYRKNQHYYEALKYIKDGIIPNRNKRKIFKIASIIKKGYLPIISVLKNELTEDEAYVLEYELINIIGRTIDKTGPLLNYLPGGQIINGFKFNKIEQKVNKKSVIQYDLSGLKINEWPSVHEAKQATGFTHISACCRGERLTAGGYVWKYKDVCNNIKRKYKARESNNVKNRKSIEQYDLNGLKIAEYSCAADAEKQSGISRSSLSNHLIGLTKTAGGYVWKYKLL